MQFDHEPIRRGATLDWLEAAFVVGRRNGAGSVAFFGAGLVEDPRRVVQWIGHAVDDVTLPTVGPGTAFPCGAGDLCSELPLPRPRDADTQVDPPDIVRCTAVVTPPPLASVNTPPGPCRNLVIHRVGPAECLDTAPSYPRTIQDCVRDAYHSAVWPGTDCGAPCIAPQPAYLPSQTARGQAAHLFLVRPLTRSEAVNSVTNYVLFLGDPSEETDLVLAAICLLRDQFDLVRWAVCTAASWSPLISETHLSLIERYVADNIQAPRPGGSRGFNTYLVGRFMPGDYTPRTPQRDHGPFAWATAGMEDPINCSGGTAGCIESHIPPEGPGVIFAAEHQSMVTLLARYRAALTGTGRLEAGMDALVQMACILLHENLHLASQESNLPGVEQPGVAADPTAETYEGCWPVQIQACANLCYALGQRFPSLVTESYVGQQGQVDAFMRTW